ncbi:hypothetical protein FHG64_18695 [Antarcticibacterium flavum]|uniref:YncE family protein n=1 Tax=Antarcticibacterium flavum TaxID=2058175 RepID=A0A5B7X743_9FLAO|nr:MULTISPECIES: DUF5074 domain-containing protein [Antarcticibacterium]QCY71257.1 hypothetical protein FHG64_18695 [Antarcticibacterium flavum]
MKINNFLSLAIAAVALFTSCQSDDAINNMPEPVAEEEFSNGIFILNEGNFGGGNSSVAFVDEEHSEVSLNVFSEANAGMALGDVAQSMGFYEDYAFIVVNVSNKIEIVNRNTFEHVATIDEGLENPRFLTFSNGFAYVTNWGDGSNPEDDFVAVIDIDSFTILENIAVEEGPEAIVEANGILYVAHLGGFSFNDKISVINTANNTVEETIIVGDRPNSLEITNNSLWVATGGLPSYAEQETAGKIVRIDLATGEIEEELFFPNPTDHPANLRIDNDIIYYTLNGDVYSFTAGAEDLPVIPFLEMAEVASLYGFEVEEGYIYAASANADFTGDGDLYIYDATNGSLINDFKVGINPNGIYFNQ